MVFFRRILALSEATGVANDEDFNSTVQEQLQVIIIETEGS
ncbi:hypothetical protein ACFLVD_00425 [Chloroflexota bacterium]